MRLGVYTRISLDPRGISDSPVRQEEACIAWAERAGHEVVAVYRDRDVSGFRDVRRPGFEALMTAAMNGEFDGILCWRIDRLLRNWRDWARLDGLLARGVVLLTEDGTDSRRDEAILAIKVAFAKEESRRISERMRAKLAWRAKNGEIRLSKRGYGYTTDMQVIEHEARVIRWIAGEIIAGSSLTGIARSLNERGIPTLTGRRWTQATIRALFGRRTICGQLVHSGQLYDGKWEPIIEPETWKRVDAILSGRKRGRTPSYWLAGLVVCGICGKKMYPGGRQVTCRAGRGHLAIQRAHLERAVMVAMMDILADRTAGKARDRESVLADIEQAEQAIRRADEALFVTGVLTPERHKHVTEQLASRLRALQEELDRADEPEICISGADFPQWWESLPDGQRAWVVRAEVEAIEILPKEKGAGTGYDPSRIRFRYRQ